MPTIISLAIAFTATFFSLWLLQSLAIKIGLVDTPHGRKQHHGEVPLTGGIAMFLGFLFALLTLSISLLPFRSFIAGCALLVFIGVLDDFHELSARARFVAQTLAALLMVAWGKVELSNLGDLFFAGNVHLGEWGLPFTVIAVIGIINAVNMTDGVDGLAGGLAFVELGWLLFLAYQNQLLPEMAVLSIILASLLGFLCFNFPIPGRKRALAFMGDAGSMLLGFVLVFFLIELSQGQSRIASPVTMLWIMTLPLFDIGGVMLRRLSQRRSVFAPDREHLHHIMQGFGLNSLQISLTLCVVALLCGLVGITLTHFHVSDGIMFISFLVLFVVYLSLLTWLRRR